MEGLNMKLRKLFATAAMALCVAIGASAQTQEEIRVYINPGHGSWGPNDRPQGTVKHGANNPYLSADNDTTNFFESNTNLEKCFGLLEKLIDYGVPFDRTKNQTNANPHRIGAALDMTQNIVMSHVKVGAYPAYSNYNTHTENPDNDYYNRSLSEIAAEVDANDFDVFISIHSNAGGDNEVNYLYFIIDGYGTNDAKDALSKEIARCGWNHRILDRHQAWTHYDYTMTAADLAAGKGKIAKQNASVLRHNVPSYLVEGYFHTYEPSRHRAMNWDADRIEGADYARGIADYYCWDKEQVGDIYGVVRDMHEKFTHEYYHGRVGTNDIYLPLNNVKVTLKKGGAEIATYTTDDEYNGAFVFRSLAPGDYTVEFSYDDYKTGEPVSVTVKAAKTVYPTAFLESKNYVPARDKFVNFPDSLAGKDYELADSYNVECSEISLLQSQLADKTVRRQIVRDNKLYVLALDANKEPYIYLADLVAGSVTELDKAAVVMSANGRLKISDIALSADHTLIASGLSKTQYGDSYVEAGDVRGEVYFYKWTQNESTGLPETCELWFSSKSYCNYYRCYLGKSIAYSGTIDEGILSATAAHGTTTVNTPMRFAQYIIEDGKCIDDTYINTFNDPLFYPDAVSDCEDFELMISPLTDGNLVYDGNKIAPFEWSVAGSGTNFIVGRNELIDKKVNGANYFKYNGKTVMVAPDIDDNGKLIGIKAFNITDGFNKATEIALDGTQISPTDYSFASAHGELALEIDDSDRDNPITVGAEIELFLVVDGKVYKYSTAQVSQPATPNSFAYNLALTQTDDKAILSFYLSGASNEVKITLNPIADGETKVYKLGALESGAHSLEVDLSTLADNKYSWNISVSNKTNIGSSIIYSNKLWDSTGSLFNGGIAIDNDPESNNFGNVYVSASTKGIFVYGADGEILSQSGYWAAHAGDLNRGAVSNGKFYVADNSAAKGGIWMFDPANPSAENQVTSAAASCAVDFIGEGNNRIMYTVSDVISTVATGASGYQLYKYTIGENDTWTTSPSWVSAADAKMFGSSHHSVIAVENGQFVSQYRTTSSNYAPGFFFIDNAGTVFNYATDLQSLLPGSEKGGMALSEDGKLFAIIGLNATIQVYDVEWTNGIPAFTHNVSIPTNEGTVWQMAFDYANNLHCYNEKAGYYMHAVPCDANVVVTPAKGAHNINGSTTALSGINADNNAPVEYYNLQGIKVSNPVNGLFIRKQGAVVSKVVK